MLILTRRMGEAIYVFPDGEDNPETAIKIALTGREGNSIKVGIAAPMQVDILREEVVEKRPKIKERVPY